MSPPILRHGDVLLRPLTLEDAPALFAAHGDEGAHHYWSGPAHASVAETARYIADTLALPGAYVWAITDSGARMLVYDTPHTLEEEDRAETRPIEEPARHPALGRIALFVQREGVGEIGVILAPDAQGRGLASAALALVEQYGFGPLGLHRIAADIDPENTASLALFERAGYQREGLLRGNWLTHLGQRDSVILGKVRVG